MIGEPSRKNNTLRKTVPFGKFQGEPMWVLLREPGYLTWCLLQPSLWKNYPRFMDDLLDETRSDDFWNAVMYAKRKGRSS